ncbi:hypothetical protein AVEN_214794-1 [Araneus ventricosus]|uniref:Uncharacterized protein n=1 Tax=Araneus ventricosus TaxID=182803 RepID=A0A4Y2H4G1_ARAVE|nr:hypothetical protein AVEN_159942-1 [Araneus ventricosus]GBM61209.1 hypothetical protein AVEN_214794-1 [Araneus ventricosus]
MPTSLKPFPDYIIRRDLFETLRRLTSGEHPSSQDHSIALCLWPLTLRDPRQRFVIGENCLLLRQMKIAELVTPPRRAGSKVLFKLELWRD